MPFGMRNIDGMDNERHKTTKLNQKSYGIFTVTNWNLITKICSFPFNLIDENNHCNWKNKKVDVGTLNWQQQQNQIITEPNWQTMSPSKQTKWIHKLPSEMFGHWMTPYWTNSERKWNACQALHHLDIMRKHTAQEKHDTFYQINQPDVFFSRTKSNEPKKNGYRSACTMCKRSNRKQFCLKHQVWWHSYTESKHFDTSGVDVVYIVLYIIRYIFTYIVYINVQGDACSMTDLDDFESGVDAQYHDI